MLALSTLQAATMQDLPLDAAPGAAFVLVHHWSLILLLVPVAPHIGAVLLDVFGAEDILVTPMLSGRKRVTSNMAAADREFSGNGRALALLVVVAAALWVLIRP